MAENQDDTDNAVEDDAIAETLSDAIPADAIYNVNTELSAVLGRATLQVSQLLKLGRGAVVVLDHGVDDPVELEVNGKLVARGEVAIVDDHLAVTMTEIVKGHI